MSSISKNTKIYLGVAAALLADLKKNLNTVNKNIKELDKLLTKYLQYLKNVNEAVRQLEELGYDSESKEIKSLKKLADDITVMYNTVYIARQKAEEVKNHIEEALKEYEDTGNTSLVELRLSSYVNEYNLIMNKLNMPGYDSNVSISDEDKDLIEEYEDSENQNTYWDNFTKQDLMDEINNRFDYDQDEMSEEDYWTSDQVIKDIKETSKELDPAYKNNNYQVTISYPAKLDVSSLFGSLFNSSNFMWIAGVNVDGSDVTKSSNPDIFKNSVVTLTLNPELVDQQSVYISSSTNITIILSKVDGKESVVQYSHTVEICNNHSNGQLTMNEVVIELNIENFEPYAQYKLDYSIINIQ